ncbi:class I adenylate cyclase, partial [Salmonella enterica subsp. enterica serovar Kentucky]|nr:class I adenylate cyclase [Salmonella enterica subsp. enterica serovar Kentucky]
LSRERACVGWRREVLSQLVSEWGWDDARLTMLDNRANWKIDQQIDGMVLLSSRLPFDASVEEQRNLPPMVMSNEFAPELELPTV